MAEVTKGYKGFDKDFCCRGYRFEVGKTYVHEGEVVLCESGFHFCVVPVDVLLYYDGPSSRYAEVEASGKIVPGVDKCVCSEIRIVRELTLEELLALMPDGMRTRENGDKLWYMNGKLHRDGGLPAVECADGSKEWYVNDELHRDGDLPAVEYADNSKFWYKDGNLHRGGDLPAMVHADGSKYWFANGQMHRDGDMPAVELANGNKEWRVNGKLHRDGDLPAMVHAGGSKFWYKDGNLHRDGGLPAVELANGNKEWWVDGVKIK